MGEMTDYLLEKSDNKKLEAILHSWFYDNSGLEVNIDIAIDLRKRIKTTVVTKQKNDAIKSLVMAKMFCDENNCTIYVNAINLAIDILTNKEINEVE